MNLNSLLFPAPQSSYSTESLPGEIVYVPKEDLSSNTIATSRNKVYIPCLFLPYSKGSTKLMIYFHGNAEDIGLAYELLDHLRNTIKVHVLAMEYQGYGIYSGSPSAQKIIEDAHVVFDFFTNVVKWPKKDIILFGRSIGSGPATELAATMNPGALLLMSAYTSIRGVVKHIAGKVVQFLVAERFKNIDLMANVTCPTFLVHGQQDTLIPYSHSQELHSACQGPSSLILPTEMDHNEFDFYDDLSQPFYFFLLQCRISMAPTSENDGILRLPDWVYKVPEDLPRGKNSSVWNKMIRKFF